MTALTFQVKNKTMKFRIESDFLENTRKIFKLNLELVVVLVRKSKALYCVPMLTKLLEIKYSVAYKV